MEVTLHHAPTCAHTHTPAACTALQENCNSGDQSLNLLRIGRAVGTLFPHYDCQSLYRWQWWTTFYAFTVLTLLTIALATGFIASARSALLALVAINVVLQMVRQIVCYKYTTYIQYECNTFFFLREVVSRYGYTDLLVRGRVFFAGCVVHAGIGFAFILALGSGRSGHPHLLYSTTYTCPGTEQALERVFQWRSKRDAGKVQAAPGRVVVDEQVI